MNMLSTNHNHTTTEIQTLAPHSVDAEEAVLGSLLINPDCLIDVSEVLKGQSDFYIVRNGWIYEAILAVYGRGEAIDTLTIVEELRNRKQLEQIGGPAYLAYLSNNTPSHIHAATYANIVKRTSVRRRLLDAATKIGQVALEENAELADILNHAESVLRQVITGASDDKKDVQHISAVTSRYIDELALRGSQPMMMTGFSLLDNMLGGMARGELMYLGARPGCGKSSALLNFTVNLAKAGKRVMFFSMEMQSTSLVQRVIASIAKVDSQLLRRGIPKSDIHESDPLWGRVMNAIAELDELPIHLDENTNTTIGRIERVLHRMRAEGKPIDVVMLDYIQLMNGGKGQRNSETRDQELSEISRNLKTLSMEYDCWIVSAAQLNRKLESRSDKTPMLSDFRDSGSLEQDGDVCIGLSPDKDNPSIIKWSVLKNRNGAIGSFKMYFNAVHTQFTAIKQ